MNEYSRLYGTVALTDERLMNLVRLLSADAVVSRHDSQHAAVQVTLSCPLNHFTEPEIVH